MIFPNQKAKFLGAKTEENVEEYLNVTAAVMTIFRYSTSLFC